MILWLIILGTGLAGGLLVLHGFGKAKEVREGMLEKYWELLDEIERQAAEEEHHGNRESRQDA